jgi:hypothetical protein
MGAVGDDQRSVPRQPKSGRFPPPVGDPPGTPAKGVPARAHREKPFLLAWIDLFP